MTPEARARIVATIADLQALLDEDCDCPETTTTTVLEIWNLYAETLPKGEQWVASTISTMRRLLARVGDLKVSALKVAHLDDYRADPEIRARYSSATLNIQAKRLRTCLTWAVDGGRIATNPLRRMKLLRPKPKRETEITMDGEAAILDRVEGWMRAFFLIAIDSAMRRDEIRLLEWQDIDWTTLKIRIPAARTKARRERIGRLTARAAEAIKAIPRVPGAPHVFANPETKLPYARSAIWKRWRAAADGAKLKAAPGDGSVRLHDCRGSAISRLVRAGASMPAIQQIAGHAHLSTTAGYVRVQSKDVDEAHALLEAHLILTAAQRRKGPQRAKSATGAHEVRKVSTERTRASG